MIMFDDVDSSKSTTPKELISSNHIGFDLDVYTCGSFRSLMLYGNSGIFLEELFPEPRITRMKWRAHIRFSPALRKISPPLLHATAGHATSWADRLLTQSCWFSPGFAEPAKHRVRDLISSLLTIPVSRHIFPPSRSRKDISQLAAATLLLENRYIYPFTDKTSSCEVFIEVAREWQNG